MLSWFAGSRLGRVLQMVLVAAGLLFAAVLYGRTGQRKANQIKDLRDYVDTTKKVESVTPSAGGRAALERMRKNGWIR